MKFLIPTERATGIPRSLEIFGLVQAYAHVVQIYLECSS